MSNTTTAGATVVSSDTLIHAHTTQESCGTFLGVYRSVALRDNHPLYQPVADLLLLFNHVLLTREFFTDPGMMFGRAELACYRLV